MTIPPAITVSNLGKLYRLDRNSAKSHLGEALTDVARFLVGRSRERDRPVFWALRDVSFTIASGERVGIIGRNGAGKSTLLKILSRIILPTTGEAVIHGRVTSLLEVGTGFNDQLTGRENIYLNASLHGLGRAETRDQFDAIVEFSEIGARFVDTPVKYYSSGMRARLAFSVAAHLNPDILLLDEVLSVGDMAFQQKCLHRIHELSGAGRTLLFVSHSIESVRRFCDRCIWLEGGVIAADGSAKEVTTAYTQRMMKTKSKLVVESDHSPPPPVRALRSPSLPLAGTLPATACARIISAEVLDEDGAHGDAILVTRPFRIEVVYDVTADDVLVLPAFRFFKDPDILAFSAVYTEADYATQPKMAGRYKSVVHIPENLLNTGMYRVSIGLSTPTSRKLVRHHAVDNALSFHVYDAPPAERSARGAYPHVGGAVRPLLRWSTDIVGPIEHTEGGSP